MTRAAVLAAALAAVAGAGCLGMSGIRNGPARERMRSATRVVGADLAAGTVDVARTDDVTDASRPFGFGVGAKLGVAYGGMEAEAQPGYTQDLYLLLVGAFGRWYVAPQLAFTMTLHGGSTMAGGQSALALPVDVEGGVRVADRLAVYGAAGRSLWGHAEDAGVEESMTFWRGRAGGLLVLRNGSFEHREITLRLEGFATTGSGERLDYDAVGGLFQLDFTWTGSGY
jgi:hypothetical protein